MKWLLALLAGSLLAMPGCYTEKLDPALASYVDSVMSASFSPGRPGAVILVAKDGIPLFRRAYGLASIELGVPAVPEDVFAIASMTKQFTSGASVELLAHGKLSLQDDIRKYLPGFETHGRVITIEHLLTHTNGIRNITMEEDFGPLEVVEPSRGELLEAVKHDSLLFEPGSDISYNDYGYTLAALIVEKASGMTFHDYLQRNIFDSLEMQHTTFGTRERTIPRFVSGYVSAGDTLFRPAEYFSWHWNLGMGDMLSSVDDLLKWDEALYTDRLVSRELLKKAWTPFILKDGRETNYGYGWAVTRYEGMQMIWHPGGMQGFRSLSIRIPSHHLFVVGLSNQGGGNAIISCAWKIALKIAGKPYVAPPFRHLRADELGQYAGVYEASNGGLFAYANQTRERVYRTIRVQDTLLLAQRTGGPLVALRNAGEDLFLSLRSLTYAHFRREGQGKIASVEFYNLPLQFGFPHPEKRTALPLPKEKVPIVLGREKIGAYAGKYTIAGDEFVKVRVDSTRIFLDTIGEIFPESETRFFSKNPDATVEFLKDPHGVVRGLILTRLGSVRAKKID